MASVSSIAKINTYQSTYNSTVASAEKNTNTDKAIDFSDADKEYLEKGLNTLSTGIANATSQLSSLNTLLGSLPSGNSGKTNSVSSLWGTSSIWEKNNGSAGSIFNSVNEGQAKINSVIANNQSMSGLLDEYSSISKSFYGDFDTAINNLASAAKNLKNTDFNVIGATDEETDQNIAKAAYNVAKFLDSYNTATNYLSSNADVSKKVKSLGNSFADNTYNSSALSRLGISVGANGLMSLDSEKFSAALKDSAKIAADNNLSSNSVGDALNSLASKAENKVSFANYQRDNLFPSINEMMGTSVKDSQALYRATSSMAAQRYSVASTLLNYLF